MSFTITHVPCLADNYAYILVCAATKQCAFVDPVEPDKVFAVADRLGAKCVAVLTTHHHEDHAGGNVDVVKRADVPVYGGDDRVAGLTRKVGSKDVISIGKVAVRVLETPCHTSGSVSYFVEDETAHRAVFTGDTLFLGGCGRFFEGTAAQMHHALNVVLAGLPDNTHVYCGHEYTVSNLKFGQYVEPNNVDIQTRLSSSSQLREAAIATVPGTIGEEKKTNPFMRTHVESVAKATSKVDPIDVMAALRQMKNDFK
jgi:hydroxyacylglutathione hydrolase